MPGAVVLDLDLGDMIAKSPGRDAMPSLVKAGQPSRIRASSDERVDEITVCSPPEPIAIARALRCVGLGLSLHF